MIGYLGFVMHDNGDWELVATNINYNLLQEFLAADYSDYLFEIIGW